MKKISGAILVTLMVVVGLGFATVGFTSNSKSLTTQTTQATQAYEQSSN